MPRFTVNQFGPGSSDYVVLENEGPNDRGDAVYAILAKAPDRETAQRIADALEYFESPTPGARRVSPR